MATQTLPAATATPTASRRLIPPIVLGLATAGMLHLAFPGRLGEGAGYLAWFAMAPLFGLVRARVSRRSAYLAAMVGGLAFWLATIPWVMVSDDGAWVAWLAMATVLACWWPAFLALTRVAVLRLGLPLMLAAPVVWVALEFVQGYFLSGFPWYYLAHTQYKALPIIQIADFAGAWGPSFLIALVNAWWVDMLTLPLLRPTANGPRMARVPKIGTAVVACLLVGTLGYGAFRLQSARFRPGPKLCLLQSDIQQKLKMSDQADAIRDRYAALVERAFRKAPDLIVWPETSLSVPILAFDPNLGDDALTRILLAKYPDGKEKAADWRAWGKRTADSLRSWAEAMQTPMIVGATTYDFRPNGLKKFNSAVLITPGMAAFRSYHKMHLVPFGEYVPLIGIFPWLTRLTPYGPDNMPSLAFGSEPIGFDLKGVRYATAICFEDTVPRVCRRFFDGNDGGRQPDVLLNISNDGWFRGSAEPEMHLAISVFRAVENRAPLARAVNTGVSALVDGNGRIVQRLGKGQGPDARDEILTVIVPLDDREAFYSRAGDWLAWGCLAVTIGLVPVALIRQSLGHRQNAPLAQSPLVG